MKYFRILSAAAAGDDSQNGKTNYQD